MASLNTFGAILGFAIELEARLAGYYQQLGNLERAQGAEQRRAKLERVRRENVVEITLEPIEGLDEADYILNLDNQSSAGRAALEATASRFYEEVAPKINVRQAQRVLERCAKEHAALVALKWCIRQVNASTFDLAPCQPAVVFPALQCNGERESSRARQG